MIRILRGNDVRIEWRFSFDSFEYKSGQFKVYSGNTEIVSDYEIRDNVLYATIPGYKLSTGIYSMVFTYINTNGELQVRKSSDAFTITESEKEVVDGVVVSDTASYGRTLYSLLDVLSNKKNDNVEGSIEGNVLSFHNGLWKGVDLGSLKIENIELLDKSIRELLGYFENGAAKSALRLSDEAEYKAWGQVFFKDGKPVNVSGEGTFTHITAESLTIGNTVFTVDGNTVYVSHKGDTEDSVTPINFLVTGALATRAFGDVEEEGTGGGMDHVYNVDDFFSKALDSFNKVSETDTFNAYAIRSLYEMVKKIENSSTDTSYVDGKIDEVNKKIDTNTAYLSEWIERVDDTLQENIDTVAGDLSTLRTTVNDFLTGTDTDTIINRWKELEAFLAGYTETSTLADLLSGKADKATTLAGYGITNAYTKAEVDGKITSVNTSVTTLQTTVSGHTTSINSLQSTVSGHTSSITSINSEITTLQGYFTYGVANSALRLSDGAEYKAWGQVFFKNGKPVNVSGEGTFTQVNADSVLLRGKARLSYDSTLDALLLTKDDGTAVHFLASGAVATRGLGEIEEGGGGTGTGVNLLSVTSDIIPIVGGSYSLGASGKPWKDLFVGDIQSKNIMPSSHYTYSLGADENRWSKIYSVDIYATRFTMNGEPVATRNWVNSQSFAKTSDLTSINNNISSLQASTFTGANNPEGYTLTWFTQSGGGRNVTIPAYGEITDGLAGIGKNVALVDQWLIADLISYVDDAVTRGRIDLTSVASDIIPDGNLTRKLGSSSNRWSLLYVNSINAGTIAPRTDNGWDLGMTTFRWRNLYAVDGHLDSLTIGGETAATQSYVTSQLGSYATTSALSNYVTLNSAQTISGMKTFTGGITASRLYSVAYLDSSELIINAEKVNFIYDGDDADVQIGLINGYKPLTLGNTSFSPALTSGMVIGTITIGGESKTIYAPSSSKVDLSNYVTLDGEQTITGSKYFSDINANSIYLQGFELKPYNPNGDIPDRLMYDGYVLLDEYNYGEYLDSSYVKKSGDTVTGQLGFSGGTYPQIYGNGNYLILAGSNENAKAVIVEKYGFRPYVDNRMLLGISGNRWSNVYSVLGNFSGQITSSVADGTSPFVVASKTLVSNLNADMLDGKHLSEILASDITGNAATATYATSAGNANNATTWGGFKYYNEAADYYNNKPYFKLVTIRIKGGYANSVVSFDVSGRSKGVAHIEVYFGAGASTGLHYASSVAVTGNSLFADKIRAYTIGNETDSSGNIIAKVIEVWYTNQKTSYDSVVVQNVHWGQYESVEINCNVYSSLPTSYESYVDAIMGSIYGSITKLTTPRTLWGQSFDGSGNVSGNLTGVGTNITGSSQLIISSTNGDIAFRHNSDESKSVVLNATQFKPYNSANLKLDLGSSSARWKGIYGQSLDLSGTLGVTGVATFGNDILYNSGDAVLKIYDIDIDSENYGNEAVVMQTCFDDTDPETSDYVTRYEQRCNLLLQPRGGQVYVGYTPTSIQNTYSLNVSQKLRLYGDANSTNTPEISFYRDGVSSWKIMNNRGNLIFQNNYTTAVQSIYFDVLKLNYNTGNATLKGSLTTGGNILPSTNKSYSLGATDNRWARIFGQMLNLSGHIYLPNSGMIYAKNASDSDIGLLQFNNINNLLIGQGVAKAGYNTNIYGNTISLAYGTAGTTSNTALFVNSDGNVGIGTTSPTYKLDVNGTFNVSGDATIGGETVATQVWVNSQNFVNAEGGTINNAKLTGDVTGNGWSIEGGIANFGEVNADSLYVGGEGVLTSSSLANYVTLNSAQTISGKKTFTGGITVQNGITASHLYSVEYLDSSELTINAEKVNFIYDGDDADVQIGLINGYKPLTLGNTSFTSTYTGGIAIGTIKIGDVVKTIYAPSGGSDLSYITQDVTISVNPEDIDQASFRLYFGDGGNIFGMYTDDGRELNLDADVVYAAMVGVLHTELLRCYEVIQMSDIRYKDIKESVHLELSDIAAAPTFRFNWKDKDNKKNYVGSSAQYWQSLVEEFVVEDKKTGKLGLDYSTAALVSAISIAREVNTMKMWQTTTTDRIGELEERVKALEEENKALRELLNSK